MPKYLMRGRYTASGLAGAVGEGFASREEYVRQLARLLDSEVDAVYCRRDAVWPFTVVGRRGGPRPDDPRR